MFTPNTVYTGKHTAFDKQLGDVTKWECYMNTLNKRLAAIALLTVASAPAHSMPGVNFDHMESYITPSPLAQPSNDLLWAAEVDNQIDAYMPIGNERIVDLAESGDSIHWMQ